jgi:hypothetical protein
MSRIRRTGQTTGKKHGLLKFVLLILTDLSLEVTFDLTPHLPSPWNLEEKLAIETYVRDRIQKL